MNEQKLKGWLGLSLRAGQAVFGEDGCRKAVSKGQCALLLMDGGASMNTRKRYEAMSGRTGVRFYILPEGLMEEATGKPGMAMGIRTGSLAEQIITCLDQAEDDR